MKLMVQKMKLSIHLLTKNLKTYTKRTKSIIMINFFHLLNNFSLVITSKCFYFTEEKHRMLFKSYFMEAQIEEEAKKKKSYNEVKRYRPLLTGCLQEEQLMQ